MPSILNFVALCLLSGGFASVLLRYFLSTSNVLPPGPSSLPIVGNLLHFPLPTHQPWVKLTEWKRTFGDIVYVHGLQNSIVVLNTLEGITDILTKRGHLYAHRPIFTMAGELMGLDRSMAIMSATKPWKHQRRLAHTAFSTESVKKYYGAQEDIAVLTSLAILEDPTHFIDHVRLATGRIVMSVTYGISPTDAEHDYIAHAEDTMMLISDTVVPGAYLVDAIPLLKHLPRNIPFITFHDKAKEGKAMMEKMVFPPFYHVKNDMARDVSELGPSFVKDLLSTPTESDQLEQEAFENAVIWTAGSMYGAGGETTYATVLNCILAMALYPDKQCIVQAELDQVLVDRLPTIADRESTPYLNALIKEVLRWHPSLPLGIPHRSSKGVHYKGFFLPQDTIAIPNIWAVSREPDPDFDPEDFVPERFLPRESNFVVSDPLTYVFGFGRRLCPGKNLAENSLYVMLASLIYCFSFGRPRDADGVEQDINPTWKSGLTSFPDPFQCHIQPRSPKKALLIQRRAFLCSN